MYLLHRRTYELDMGSQVTERGDTQRPLSWRLRLAAATLSRRLISFRNWRPHNILIFCAVAACVGVVLIDYLPAGLAALVIAVGAVAQPVLFRLKHGRVWELRPAGSGERARCIGWAVIIPHRNDQKTWKLDVTLHPLCEEHPGWADALVEQVNAAADVFDVSVQSMDPHDEPVLIWHGYLPADTLLSRAAVLQRFSPAHEPLDKAGTELQALRELVSENRRDLMALQRLTDEALVRSKEILSRPSVGWDHVVMRRTGALWELARAAAIGLDGYIEFLSLGRLDPSSFPEGAPGLEARLDRLSEALRSSAVTLRNFVQEATVEFKVRGGEPLQWAQSLALLEVEALSLCGLVCAARRGPSVTLAVIEPEMQGHVVTAARSVRNHARSLRSRRLFDTVGLVWWALAIAADAFDLCGHRSSRFFIRSAIRKLKANDLRHMVVIPRAQRVGESEPLSDDPIERWEKLTSVKRLGQPPGKALADLSATRTRRIGMPRGAEGLRQKRLRRAIWALAINNLLLLLVGLVVWLFAMSLRNWPSGLLTPLGYVINELNPDFPVVIERPGSGYHFTPNLSVSTSLAWESTLALLAVVITGAVAVAVASPREMSTRVWAQDRAWQLFIVMVGYAASTAALVLALAPLPLWSTLKVNERAEALTALGFAILTACAATSTSALQSRLDTWQDQRRSLTASLRLRRANDRLGPPYDVVSLFGRAIGCFAVCLLPLWLLILVISVFTDTTPEDFWWVLLTLTALNLIPMTLLTMLFVIKWANDWGLAGRVANAMLFALLTALLVYEVLYVIAFLTEDPYLDVFVLFFLQSPIVAFWFALFFARALARQDRIWTGPATFALHMSIRLARWNYQRSNA
jgi:hypothetical protein